MAAIDPNAIAQARAAGYSDTEIADHLAQDPGVKSAREAGYSDKEIISHITGDKPEASGVGAGLNHGTADTINAVKATAKNYFGVGDGPAPEDKNYVPANVTNGSLNPLKWNYDQLPQKAAEMAPGIAEQLVAAKTGAKIGKSLGGVKGAALGAMLASGASLWANTAGNAAQKDAEARTGDAKATPNAEDLTRAGLTSAASAAVQSVGPTRFTNAPAVTSVGSQGALAAIKKYLTTTAANGAAAGAGNVVNQVGNTIGTPGGTKVDGKEAVGDALGNMVVTGALGAPRLAAETTQAVNRAGMDTPAMRGYIQRLTDAAGSEGLGNSKKDFNAQENAKAGLRTELRAVDHSAMDQDTQNSLNLARSGKALTPEDVTRINASDPQAGFLADQLHHAQQAEGFGTYDTGNKTWAGGVSGKMDKLMRNYVDPTKVLTGVAAGHVLGLHLLGTASPAFAGAAAGSYGIARTADSLAGLRSPAKAFAQRFQNAQAQTRLPGAAPQQSPQTPPQPNAPWGPRPPPQQSVPQSAPPGPPQPAAPQLSPIAMSMLKQSLKAGPPPAPAPAAPAAPSFNPIALKMLGSKLKAGIPEEPAVDQEALDAASVKGATKSTKDMLDRQAYLAKLRTNSTTFNGPPLPPSQPPQAPEPETPQVNPMRLPTDITAPAENLMKGLAAAQNMRAANTPPITANGAANGAPAPKTMADVLNSVNAISTPTKISKKAGGAVKTNQAPQAPQADPWANVGSYSPEGIDNPHAGKTPAQIARATADAMPSTMPALNRMSYYNRTLGTRTARDNAVASLAQQHPADQAILAQLREDLHAPGNSDQIHSRQVIKHYAGLMSHEAGAATRALFDRADTKDAIWPPSDKRTTSKAPKSEVGAEPKTKPKGKKSKQEAAGFSAVLSVLKKQGLTPVAEGMKD